MNSFLDMPPAEQAAAVDWSTYAETYDMLLDHNPAYQDLLNRFERFVSSLPDSVATALDIGAGTGNFAALLARQRPHVQLSLLEPDPQMRARAQAKINASAKYISIGFEDYDAPVQFDLIVTTHAIYTLQDPQAGLAKMHQLTRPGGWLFAIDFGRQMRIWDWRLYLMTQLLRSAGPLKTWRLARAGREIARQNGRVGQLQRSGRFWRHDRTAFVGALQQAGWTVLDSDTVYRGYSSLAICRK
ncbi:MAG: class I SAM-dependent methyltransferase [Pseudomonadota bacterium]